MRTAWVMVSVMAISQENVLAIQDGEVLIAASKQINSVTDTLRPINLMVQDHSISSMTRVFNQMMSGN
jgi:hypothetical protein